MQINVELKSNLSQGKSSKINFANLDIMKDLNQFLKINGDEKNRESINYNVLHMQDKLCTLTIIPNHVKKIKFEDSDQEI